MPDTPDPLEKLLWELTAAHDAALDEVAVNDRVFKAVATALGSIARDHYPGMANWNAAQLRQLAARISRQACSFTLELSSLDSAGQR
jgi:hypothetical protein